MVNELIEAVIASLKEEEVFLNYMQCTKDLNQYKTLLSDYKTTKEEYMKMRPYFKYQDFSELKERFQKLASEVEKLDAYHNYLNANNKLQERLNELSQIIFEGVLIEVEGKTCESSQGSINEEI